MTLREALEAKIEEWREEAGFCFWMGDDQYAFALDKCADELEELLKEFDKR